MKTMKNTKALFLISFFGCFVLPAWIGIFAALSIFFNLSGNVSNWVLLDGGFWVLIIYQIIIILITTMLYLTLRLKDVEIITTEEVVHGKKTEVTIKKIEPLSFGKKTKNKRKQVKVLEVIDESGNKSSPLVIKEVKRRVRQTNKENVSAPVTSTNTTPKKMFSATRK